MSDFEKLDHVDYIEDAPRDPFWWRKREMTAEEEQIYQQALEHHRLTKGTGVAASCYHLLRDGGGINGMGITHSEWPKRIWLVIPPFKGYFSEAGKQQMLKMLDDLYAQMRREIEEA